MKEDLFGHLFEVILRHHFKSPKLTPGTIDGILIQVQNDFYQERLIWSFGCSFKHNFKTSRHVTKMDPVP